MYSTLTCSITTDPQMYDLSPYLESVFHVSSGKTLSIFQLQQAVAIHSQKYIFCILRNVAYPTCSNSKYSKYGNIVTHFYIPLKSM